MEKFLVSWKKKKGYDGMLEVKAEDETLLNSFQ